MTTVVYLAKRSLITGHVAGSTYRFDLSCQDLVPGREKSETMNQAMSGLQETFLYFTKQTYDVSLAPLQGASLDLVLEFLDSVSGRETFTFDPYGKVDFPVKPITAVLTSNPYTLTPTVRIGKGGRDDFYGVSFSVREQ